MSSHIKLRLNSNHDVHLHRTDGTKEVVMVNLLDNNVTPWATYRIDDKGNCFWGHYWASEVEAKTDFMER